MTYRITLKGGDAYTTNRAPDIVEAGGTTCLRCIVGTRIVRKPVAEIASIEVAKAEGGWSPVKVADLGGEADPFLAGRETSTRGSMSGRSALDRLSDTPAPAPASTTDDPPATKAELLEAWEALHPGVEPPVNEKGNVTVASLRAGLELDS